MHTRTMQRITLQPVRRKCIERTISNPTFKTQRHVTTYMLILWKKKTKYPTGYMYKQLLHRLQQRGMFRHITRLHKFQIWWTKTIPKNMLTRYKRMLQTHYRCRKQIHQRQGQMKQTLIRWQQTLFTRLPQTTLILEQHTQYRVIMKTGHMVTTKMLPLKHKWFRMTQRKKMKLYRQ